MHIDIKKFLSYYRPYLGLFVLIMLCAFIIAASTLIFPLLTRHITKNILEENARDGLYSIYKTGALMVILILIQAGCSYFVDYRGHTLGAMMEHDMRNELFAHLQRLSFRFYDDQKTGKLMSRVTNDLLQLSELYHHGPEDYVIYFVKFVGTLIILLTINVPLTLAVFIFLPIMGVYSFYFNKRMNAALRRNYEQIGEVNARVEDSLSGIRVVKSFANEVVETRKFILENNRFLNSRKGIYQSEAFLYYGIQALIQFITVTVILYGGVNIINASLDLADLLTFLLYIANLVEPIQKLNHVTMQFQQGITGFQRFMEIMEIEPEFQDAPDAVSLSEVSGNISFRNVAFRYKEEHDYVLKDITLDIRAGDYVALVGTSGVGKTTLCSLIPRFYEVSKGEILLDGINIQRIALASLRRSIGVVQQDVYLFAGSVLENIRYGRPDACNEEVVEAAKKANAHDFIMGLPEGYYTDIGQRGIRLSGGQKQRLSIARVFLKNPPILIFDEATSALDNESERVVQESLERLARNRTTIVIAHRLSTVRNAERIIVLTEEGIHEQGTHDELLAVNGLYAHLYNL